MAKKQTPEIIPSANIPNVSASDPSNVSLNEYGKQKVKSDIKKKEKAIMRAKNYIVNHDSLLTQQKELLDVLETELAKLKTLEGMFY